MCISSNLLLGASSKNIFNSPFSSHYTGGKNQNLAPHSSKVLHKNVLKISEYGGSAGN